MVEKENVYRIEALTKKVEAIEKEIKEKTDDLNSFKKSMKLHLSNFPVYMEDENIEYAAMLIEMCENSRYYDGYDL